MNVAHVVPIEEDGIFTVEEDAILENPLDQYSFTFCHCRALVFSLCARQCVCRLLLTILGYESTAEGEGESLC